MKRRMLALLLTILLLLPMVPQGALAESYSAYVTANSMAVYRDAAFTSKIGDLPQYCVVKVLGAVGSVVQIQVFGVIGYANVSDMTAVSAVAKPGVVSSPSTIYPLTLGKVRGYAIGPGVTCNIIEVKGNWALVERDSIGAIIPANAVRELSAQSEPTPTPAPAATQAPSTANAIPGIVVVNRLPVYATASTSGRYLGWLPTGTGVNVMSINGAWAWIELSGNYGYCAVAGLRPAAAAETPTAAPQATEAPSTANAIPGTCVVAGLPVYQSPDVSSTVLGSLPNGMQVNVLAVQGVWAWIELNGNYGYCAVAGLRPTATLQQSTPTPAPEPTMAPSVSNAIPGTVVVNSLPVFKEASLSSTVLGSLPMGTNVNVIAIQGGWAWIELNGNYGYCAVSGLRPTSGTPVSVENKDDPLAGYTQETFSATVVVRGARFYQSADTTSTSTDLPMGVTLTVGAYNGTWAYVDINGIKGFVQVSALNRTSYQAIGSGSSGTAVENLEKALLTLGFLDSNPSSTFSTNTATAIRRFQSASGLPATGTADEGTLRVLYGGSAPSCSLLNETLSNGSKGDSVTRMQTRLGYLGYLSKTSSVDGDFGGTTANAVRLFQTANGLTVTGTADPATLRKMYSVGAASLPSGKTPADVSSVVTPSAGGQGSNVATISDTLASKTSSYNANMTAAEKLEYVIYVGQNQLGKPYVYAATGPSSFDCSGFTYYCFRQIGITLKRTAYEQGYNDAFPKISNVSELQRGDLVYFNTISDSDLCDHAGIYLGAGFFMHASSGQSKVVVSNLTSGYYNRVFSWGRRVFS